MIYAIYEGNMERLEQKMTRIQNKCRKYGCDFLYREVGEEFRELENDEGTKITARFVLVEAEGVAVVNGWKFIASVQHTKAGNIINRVCNIEVPSRYYTSKPVCEHCHSTRARKDTYIVMNESTGEFKQVGRSCLKDFTGGMSAAAVAEYTAAFEQLIQGEAPEGGHYRPYLDTVDFLKHVAETVRHFGYVKSDPESYERSTAIRACQYYEANHGRGFKEIVKEMEEVGFDADSEGARKMTEEALKWIAGQEETSNYIHNLKTAASLEYNDFKQAGLLASMFQAFSRDVARKQAKEAEASSKYYGNVGDRVKVKMVSIKIVTGWETEWGYTAIYKMMDEVGNVFTWKTSKAIEADEAIIIGTVKAHTEFRGVKQTELTRCKVA